MGQVQAGLCLTQVVEEEEGVGVCLAVLILIHFRQVEK